MASRVVIKRKKAAQKVIKNGDKVSYLASSSSMAFLICEVVVVRSSLDSGITRVSSYNDRGSYNVMAENYWKWNGLLQNHKEDVQNKKNFT